MGSVFSHHRTNADRSAKDRSRHKQKIEKAIREGIHDIVAEESIIGQDGKKKIRIPVRGIKEYRFVYGQNEGGQAGSGGDADVQRGQKIGQKKKKGKGNPDKPGDKPGEEYYDVEVTLEELAHYLFKDLELPEMEQKQMQEILSEKRKRKGYRKDGIRPRLSKKETAKQRIRRKNAAKRSGTFDEEEDFGFRESDLRYKHITVTQKQATNACIFFIMDVSGSMTKEKKYLARSFFFLLYHFIRSKYEKTEIVFVAHDTEPHETDEDKFFNRGTGGGTMVSPAIDYVIEQANKRYNPQSWNLYSFHCSDGDNWGEDMNKTIASNETLKQMCQFYGYCEITPEDQRIKWNNGSTLSEAYEPYEDEKFKIGRIYRKEDVWKVFRQFFRS